MQEEPSKGRASKPSCSVPAFTRFASRVNCPAVRPLALYNGGGKKYEQPRLFGWRCVSPGTCSMTSADPEFRKSEMSNFEAIVPALARALEKRGYTELTPVQKAVLAPELGQADALVSAQTGSGKTVAFGLALAPTLLGDAERFSQAAAAGAGGGADARAGLAGDARAGMALRAHRRHGGVLRRRNGHAHRAARAGARRPHRRRHARPPARPHHAALARHVGAQGRGAGRSRRNARSRLSRGPRIHPRRRTSRAPDADVLGHRAALHRHARPGLSARCRAHLGRRRGKAASRHRIPGAERCPGRPRERHHQRAALL